MATSGSKTIAVGSHNSLVFSWERTSSSTANNTSTVKWSMKLTSDAYGTISSSVSKSWSVTVNGTKYSGSNTVGIGASTSKTLASGTTTITHNNDGSKTFSYSFSQTFNVTLGGTYHTTKSGSGTGTLTTIARKATITSAPNFNDEANPTVSYSNPAGDSVSSLEMGIYKTDGSASYVPYRSITKTATSYTFNLTDAERANLRKAVKSGNTLSVRFYIRTTIGDTQYLDYVTKTLTLVNYTPTLSPTITSTNTTANALTGDANKLIKYFNTVSVSTGASARKNASITSQSVKNGTTTVSSASGTMSNVESGTFEVSVTDSRGYTTTQKVTKTMVNYVKLTCGLTASATLAEDNTATLTATISGGYFDGNFGAEYNSLTIQYRYKTEDGSYSSWIDASTGYTVINSGTGYTKTITLTGLDYQKSYTIQARAYDKIYTSSSPKTSSAVTVKAEPVFDWSGEDFNFNVPVSIEGDVISDFPIEQGTTAMGTNGTWYWRKWKSGRAECYGVRNYGNMGISATWGSLFTSETFTQSLPSGLFSMIPHYIGIEFFTSDSHGGWIMHTATPSPQTSATGGFKVVRAESGTAQQVYISFNVKGRWK